MESYNAAIGMPPDVPWPKPTIGSRPEIFEYDPKTKVPPVTGALVVAGVVAAVAPGTVVDVGSAPLSSPHAVAIKPRAAITTNVRLSLMISDVPPGYGSPTV
jgi:hypothetical protein